MSESFAARLSAIAPDRRIILACDYTDSAITTQRIIRDIESVSPYMAAVKLNYHLLLPLGTDNISDITCAAHGCGLQTVADIKLNDIGNTNRIATNILWDAGFDAVIANPIMGPGSLKCLVDDAHDRDRGIIALCHMSAPQARVSYEMRAYPTITSKEPKSVHEIFLDWALDSGADGIIVGATFPNIIRSCSRTIKARAQDTLVISPGVGAQGADAADTVRAGSDYVIAGRSIILSGDPARAALLMHDEIARAC